jgi:hypothetical protein
MIGYRLETPRIESEQQLEIFFHHVQTGFEDLPASW